MKQPNFFNELLTPVRGKARKLCLSSLFAAGVISQSAFGQQTFTFTNASATGSLGPTQAMITTAYASTSLNNSVTIGTQQGIQQFTVPATGAYRIEARGGQGYGNGFGGRGAVMAGDFTLTAGSVLRILVGQAGILTSVTSSNFQFGGAGGSFVTDINNVPYVVAGGGGASWGSAYSTAADAPTVTTGNTGFNGPTNGTGGTGGAGGLAGSNADAGAGITGNGGGNGGGKSFVNGGNGGTYLSYGIGAFGGGGGTSSSNNARAAGGGGYSGGGGAGSSASGAPEGGGGGSYNAGVNQSNVAATNLGNGLVIVTKLCNLNITSTSSVICTGSTVTLTTNSVGSYTWSNGSTNTANIAVSPTITTTYTLSGQGTTPAGCVGTAAYVVTVNRTPTVTINSSTAAACQGQTVSLTASGANTYAWNNGITNGVAFAPTSTALYTVTGTNACGTATAQITVTISSLPVTASASSSLICAGSPATLTAGGATSYTWLPGQVTNSMYITNPNVSTTFTVTGQTGNCQGTAMISVTTKTLPTLGISVSSGTAMCYGNSNTLTATGDATAFHWNVGFVTPNIVITPTTTTSYILTGTNVVNCSRSVAQVIQLNQNPVVSVIASNPEVCATGASTLTASGANVYAWAPNDSSATHVVHPASSTAYNVTGINTLTGCFTATAITVSVFEPFITVTNNTTICNGGHVIIGAQGAITYTWTNSNNAVIPSILVSPTVSTTYSVSGNVVNIQTGVSCITSNTIAVTVFELPAITAISNHSTICRGTSATLTADGAGATGTYTWAAALGNNPVVTVTPNLNQTYNVSATDENGCKNTATVQVAVTSCTFTGIVSTEANTINLSAYPNPSNGAFTISSAEVITLNIINQLGQQVKVIALTPETSSVNVSGLSAGVYFITGKNANGSVKQKIVITD